MTARGSAPSSRYHHSAVVHEGEMFIFGGYTGWVGKEKAPIANERMSATNPKQTKE